MEWKEHQSDFASKWLAKMIGARRFGFVGDVENVVLRERICTTSDKKTDQQAMAKDGLLLEAALATDQRIVSLDESVRNLFRNAAKTIREITTIVWVNPDKEEENVIAWLENGVPADEKRQLGYVAVTP